MVPFSILALAFLQLGDCNNATLSNIIPKRDTAGRILDAHDGNIVFDPGTGRYLYFSVGYGDCKEPPGNTGCAGPGGADAACGFLYNHTLSVYSTLDFVSWVNEGNALPLAPPRPNLVLFSPKVIYNKLTAKWVLWANWVGGPFPYTYSVSTSTNPLGPYTSDWNDTVAMSTQFGNLNNNAHVGDLNLFLDDDGQGYLIYSSKQHVQIEPLSEDFQSSAFNATNRTSGVFPRGNEAPAMFKRAGKYYALVSDACCFCSPGGSVRAYIADAPLGPYTYFGDDRASFTWGLCPFLPLATPVSTCSQQTLVFQTSSGDVVWAGDRWQSAPGPTFFKSQDFTAFFKLDFFANGSIVPIAWANQTTFSL